MLMICLLYTYVSLDVKLVQLTGQSEIPTVYWLKIQDCPIGIPIKSFFIYTRLRRNIVKNILLHLD